MRAALGVVAGTLGGPRSYGIGLAGALAAAFPGDEWVILTDRPEAFAGLPVAEVVAVPLPAKALRPAVEAVVVPRTLRRLRLDLYHGTKQAIPRGAGCALVATLHDLAYFTMPETFPPAARLLLRREARAAARRAHRIAVPSAHTRDDAVRILGVDPGRVAVVPNGIGAGLREPAPAEEAERVRRRYGLPGRFVLCVGTLQPRKNPGVLLDAFLDLRASGAAEGVGLIFAGRRGWMCGPFLRELRRRGEAGTARLLEEVPDGDLPGLYAAAEVFASPTSYEGFGLSVAEAMAAGLPVVAGDGSSVPEVAGDAAVLVPPRDRGALAAALAQLLADPRERARLGAAARARAARFTWEVAARGMRAVYEEAVAARAAER